MMTGGVSSTPVLLLLLVASASHAISREGGSSSDHAPGHESTLVHHPAASLAIVGSLEDVKMKSSIAQLVKALQTSKPKEEDPGRRAKLELVTKNGPMKIEHHSLGTTGGRKLDYGDLSGGIVPEPIVVSSQAIRIGSNGTGGKRGRSLVDTLTGVRTIEGVRVPDDEHDKHYTWRNARVIKGFLVPNDRSPNPHKKRQTSGPHLQKQPEQVLPYAHQVQQQQQQQQQQQPLYVFSDSNSQSQSTSANQRSDTQQQLLAQAQAAVQALQQPHQTQDASQLSHSDLLQAVLQQAGAVPSGGASYIQFEQPQVADRQVQQQQQQQQYLLQQQQYQQQLLQQAQFAQRQGQVLQQQQQQQQGQPEFVVQPQTYVAGPGGQTFTVPIPVPADQVQQTQQQQQQQQQYILQAQQHHQQQQQHPHQNYQQQQHQQRNPQRGPQSPPFAKRVMAALQSNQKTLERMDTATAVVPALASTGIFLGLSALAAGWYLSKNNREVGIVKRTGKPSRAKRDLPPGFPPGIGVPGGQSQQEVDQATFFQSIIQQSLEKTQQQYEEEQPIVYQQQQQSQPEPVYQQQQEPRPKSERRRPGGGSRRNDEEDYPAPQRKYAAQEKVGALTIGSSKNFAKVFIPAFILGLSVISITALIFGWYVTGANREIAFLEPASYSRKKRSLAMSEDGWLQRVIKAIHGNPYDRLPAPTAKSLLPHPFMDSETSKTSSTSTEFAISNAGITGVLAGGAIIALVALGLANSFSDTARKHSRATGGARFQPNHRTSAGRSLTNSLFDEGLSDESDSGWISGFLTSMEQAGRAAQDSPCFKKALCALISQQDDDTLKSLEKRMGMVLPLMPQGVSSNLKEVLSSIYSKNCSVFKCTRSSSTTTNSTTTDNTSR